MQALLMHVHEMPCSFVCALCLIHSYVRDTPDSFACKTFLSHSYALNILLLSENTSFINMRVIYLIHSHAWHFSFIHMRVLSHSYLWYARGHWTIELNWINWRLNQILLIVHGHVTVRNGPYLAYECEDVSRIWIESGHADKWALSRTWLRHVSHKYDQWCHTPEWVMSYNGKKVMVSVSVWEVTMEREQWARASASVCEKAPCCQPTSSPPVWGQGVGSLHRPTVRHVSLRHARNPLHRSSRATHLPHLLPPRSLSLSPHLSSWGLLRGCGCSCVVHLPPCCFLFVVSTVCRMRFFVLCVYLCVWRVLSRIFETWHLTSSLCCLKFTLSCSLSTSSSPVAFFVCVRVCVCVRGVCFINDFNLQEDKEQAKAKGGTWM